MKSCDFEKDANAEVLFDKGDVSMDASYNLSFERHVRIKIFNDKGKGVANIHIPYFDINLLENINNVQAETINLNNGNIEITKIDRSLIYRKRIDKISSEVVFAFPNVQPGSVVEYKYILSSKNLGNFPDWYFQTEIPTRYSQFSADMPNLLHYRTLQMTKLPLVINNEATKAMINIPSLRVEPYMSSLKDNAERMFYQLSGVDGLFLNFSSTWPDLGKNEVKYEDFGEQFKRKLAGEDVILTKVKNLKTDEEKIAVIFDEVKNSMRWNDINVRYTNDGTSLAWDKKTGNSTEINLMVYHLLTKAGIKAYPMLVSTRNHGKVNPAYTSEYQFNKTVTYIPVDSAKYYILDATDKFADCNTIPEDLLDSYGLYVDRDDERSSLFFIANKQPVRQVVYVNAEIKPDGKMNGTAQLSSFSYHRLNAISKYKTDGEKKYIDYLRDDDNNLQISSLILDNMDKEDQPLVQKINFNFDLAGSDGNYIYINPNIFTSLHKNPFLNETRTTDISFGFLDDYQITGNYKIPDGYKIDALPKNISLSMPDKTITFKRFMGEQDGAVVVRYVISRKAALFFYENYPDFHEFYKKMYEMLNEQIVLKKS
ncbi:MAG: hypothetical protein JWR50_1035 [Mucilaginibacter sp.]|nr:hypothetical protein [Mucilaginibacter sp.]